MYRTTKLMLLFPLVLFALVGATFYFTALGNHVNLLLGEYGVKIQQAQGFDTNDIIGTWWNGSQQFENSMMQWLIMTFGFGVTIGVLMTFAMLRAIRKDEEEEKP